MKEQFLIVLSRLNRHVRFLPTREAVLSPLLIKMWDCTFPYLITQLWQFQSRALPLETWKCNKGIRWESRGGRTFSSLDELPFEDIRGLIYENKYFLHMSLFKGTPNANFFLDRKVFSVKSGAVSMEGRYLMRSLDSSVTIIKQNGTPCHKGW